MRKICFPFRHNWVWDKVTKDCKLIREEDLSDTDVMFNIHWGLPICSKCGKNPFLLWKYKGLWHWTI